MIKETLKNIELFLRGASFYRGVILTVAVAIPIGALFAINQTTIILPIVFGAFVNVDGIEGLIHISEISWERVEDPKKYVKTGETVKAKIIAIDKERLSLSLKQMQDDPWLNEVKSFKKGSFVEGRVTRITPFGAFVQLSPSVEALVHVSEMSDDKGTDPEKVFKVNEKESRTFSTTKTRYVDENGARFLIGVMHDITDGKKAEEDLHKANERSELLASATNDALWDWEMDKPVYPLLKKLAEGHTYGELLAISDDVCKVVDAICDFTGL